MTAPWYDPGEDSPFSEILKQARERIERRKQPLLEPYGADWLLSTGPAEWNWDKPWLQKVYEHLNALARGDILRFMLFAPVRHGKTEAVTVRFPVYWLEQFPRQQVIIGMHNLGLAEKFSRQARRVAEGRLRIDPNRDAVREWLTVEGGGFQAVGVGVGIAGQGANLFCIDDPIAKREDAESPAFRDSVWDWWRDDLYTRRNPHQARIIFTMARWHEDDLASRILNSPDAKNWTVLSLPALAEENDPLGRLPGDALDPSLWPREELEKAREEVFSSYSFAGLFQQRPAPAEGGIFKRTWWQFWQLQGQNLPPVRVRDANGEHVERHPVTLPAQMDETLQSWDMSFKDNESSDQVSGHIWSRKGSQAYLRDRDYGKKDFPKTVVAVKRMTLKWPQASRKLIEDAANGPAVIAQLRGRVGGMIPVHPDGNKIARAHAITAMVEAGDVFLPHPQNEPWVWDFIEAFAGFPTSKNDHDVDAGTQALRRMFPQGEAKQLRYVTARIHA